MADEKKPADPKPTEAKQADKPADDRAGEAELRASGWDKDGSGKWSVATSFDYKDENGRVVHVADHCKCSFEFALTAQRGRIYPK